MDAEKLQTSSGGIQVCVLFSSHDQNISTTSKVKGGGYSLSLKDNGDMFSHPYSVVQCVPIVQSIPEDAVVGSDGIQ